MQQKLHQQRYVLSINYIWQSKLIPYNDKTILKLSMWQNIKYTEYGILPNIVNY